MKEIIMTSSMSLFIFSSFRHPLVLVGVLTFQSIPAIATVIYNSHNTWMAYLLFLIFLGGLLIIFVYLSALVPNEMFSANHLNPKFFLFLTLLYTLIMFNFLMLKSEQTDPNSVTNFSSLFYHNIFIFMLIYLFICLTTTMYMTSKYKTPMKSFM